MPIPRPKDKETKEQFLQRCMKDETMKQEYTKNAQRFAVCNLQWERKK